MAFGFGVFLPSDPGKFFEIHTLWQMCFHYIFENKASKILKDDRRKFK